MIFVFKDFFHKIGVRSVFNRPNVVVSIPYGITEVEKRAVEDAAFEAGARSVALIEEPLAAAIGVGLRVGGARGSMIVDIGGGTTEVAVMSLGGIVSSRSIRTAGDALDEAIIRYLRTEKNLLVGEMTAEQLKMRIGSAHPACDGGSLPVCGRDIRTGHAVTEIITSADIRTAIKEELQEISNAIRATLEETPPELSSDIYDKGIVISGGGARLPGICAWLHAKTGIPVTTAPKPFESVCTGIGKIIESEGRMGDLLKYRGK